MYVVCSAFVLSVSEENAPSVRDTPYIKNVFDILRQINVDSVGE